MPLYSVCVATYRRPELLGDLLVSLDRQVLPPDTELEVIVVDNAPPSAKMVVEDSESPNPRVRFRYLEQPVKNISLTRNVAVDAASGSLLLFIDDDEVAHPEWVSIMAAAIEHHDADLVFGRVESSFPPATPEWITSARVFNRPCGATGTQATGMRTSNCAVRSSALEGHDGPFDEAWGLTGGEDSHLFQRMVGAGAKAIDCLEGVVVETVSADRTTLSWMIERSRRTGALIARNREDIHPERSRVDDLAFVARASTQCAAATVVAIVQWPWKRRRVTWLLKAASNLGKIEGAFGRQKQGY